MNEPEPTEQNVYPAENTLKEATDKAILALPITTTIQLKGVLKMYQNTLLKVLRIKK